MSKAIYDGIAMDAGWPLKIEESQKLPYYTSEGIKYTRIRYGDEDPRWGESPCRNCGVTRGQYHVIAECEHEKCPRCGRSVGGHACSFDEFREVEQRPSVAVGRLAISKEVLVAVGFLLILFVAAAISIWRR